MFRRHVSKYLSAFTQDELPTEQSSSVAAHLRNCDRCRKELDEIRWGISLAKHLTTLPAPSGLSNAMQAVFDSGNLSAPVSGRPRALRARWVVIPVAAVIVAVLGSVLWYKK